MTSRYTPSVLKTYCRAPKVFLATVAIAGAAAQSQPVFITIFGHVDLSLTMSW
eukprot:SAG31_NODE_9991_length_1200_cov_1.384196_1_plen_52_part_10